MASPVVINSSSPTSLRLPSVTPPSLRRDAHSSSPSELTSPALLFGSNKPALKSGSRAQAVPLNAGFGFSTAGSLWRETRLKPDARQHGKSDDKESEAVVEESAKQSSRINGNAQKQYQNAGKLKKPKKSARKQVETESVPQAANKLDLHLEDFTCAFDGRTTRNATAKRSAKATRVPKQGAISMKPSADVSEFAFGVYDLGMQTQAPAAVAEAEKSRKKKATASTDLKEKNDSINKSRRRKPRSEAVALDSDDANIPHVGPPAGEHSKTAGSKGKRSSKAKSKATVAKNATAGANRSHSRDHAVEKSSYFRSALTSDCVDAHAGQEAGLENGVKASGAEQQQFDPSSPGVAAPRRSQWTPVKDTVSALPIVADDADTASIGPKMQLADLIGHFGYTADSAKETAVARTNSGEAVTKRRRIELADSATAAPVARAAHPMPKELKKPAGRRKLQTITGLATAAYQVEQEQAADQSTVAEFLAARKGKDGSAKLLVHPVAEQPKQPKQPRKPREKKDTTAGEGVEQDAAKSRNGKKAKVKFSQADYLPKLYSPSQAANQMRQQDFLFGTSSQLVIDEPAEFIRDMQTALRASELDERQDPDGFGSQVRSSEVLPSQYSRFNPGQGKSCSKVPTAPHGTCLSLSQAQRELWCVSSRDHDGGLLREERGASKGAASLLQTADDRPCEPMTNIASAPQDAEKLPTGIPTSNDGDVLNAATANEADAVVDIGNTSPPAPDNGARGSVVASQDKSDPLLASEADGKAHQQSDADVQASDEWMLISSDGPGDELEAERVSAARPTSFVPGKVRAALRPLDVNAAILPLSAFKAISSPQVRMASTCRPVADDKPAATKKGRPRKLSDIEVAATSTPKRRDKAPTKLASASDPSPGLARSKSSQAALSASQPLHSPSGWLDIDEISDPEPAVTPSPPRRKLSASPAVPALEFVINGSPSSKSHGKAGAPAPGQSILKPGEPQWLSIRDAIFSKITSTIKAAPRGENPSRPSWYQKILMYDPITLEELTAWLNEQGLQIEMLKLKPKVKKRGRKKRDADGKVTEEDHADEWETHREPLQPWMVQKWCEERSICCVWAGGGWGGRSRH